MSVLKNFLPLSVKRRLTTYQANLRRRLLFGTLAPLVPAVEDMFDGPPTIEEFKQNGEEFFKIYQEICGLQPDERMLDIGCGIGRKTLPLTRYFNEHAAYEGVDVAKVGIDWCRKKITPRFPNFRFQQIDVYNKHYNADGKFRPSEYTFPFPDKSFSFVMLGSVFTHMLPSDLEHYLSEIYRVLATGGRCLITYFILNHESLRLVESGASSLDFRYELDGYHRTISRDVPELAVAFDEDWIKILYHNLGMEIVRVDYGSWCGRASYLSHQDLVLAAKA